MMPSLSSASVRCLEIADAECRMQNADSPLQQGEVGFEPRGCSASTFHLSSTSHPQRQLDSRRWLSTDQAVVQACPVSSSTTSFASPDPDPIGCCESARISVGDSALDCIQPPSARGPARLVGEGADMEKRTLGFLRMLGYRYFKGWDHHASALLRWLSIRVFYHQRRLLYGSLGLGTPPSHGG